MGERLMRWARHAKEGTRSRCAGASLQRMGCRLSRFRELGKEKGRALQEMRGPERACGAYAIVRPCIDTPVAWPRTALCMAQPSPQRMRSLRFARSLRIAAVAPLRVA